MEASVSELAHTQAAFTDAEAGRALCHGTVLRAYLSATA